MTNKNLLTNGGKIWQFPSQIQFQHRKLIWIWRLRRICIICSLSLSLDLYQSLSFSPSLSLLTVVVDLLDSKTIASIDLMGFGLTTTWACLE